MRGEWGKLIIHGVIMIVLKGAVKRYLVADEIYSGDDNVSAIIELKFFSQVIVRLSYCIKKQCHLS